MSHDIVAKPGKNTKDMVGMVFGRLTVVLYRFNKGWPIEEVAYGRSSSVV